MEPVTWTAVAGALAFLGSFFDKKATFDYGHATGAYDGTIGVNDGEPVSDVDPYGTGYNSGSSYDGGVSGSYDADAYAKSLNKGGSTIGNIIGAVGSVVGAIAGSKTSTGNVITTQQQQAQAAAVQAQAQKQSAYGAIVLVVIAIAGLLGVRYLLTDKKSPKRAYN